MEVASQVSDEKQQSGSDVEMATAPNSRGGSQGTYTHKLYRHRLMYSTHTCQTKKCKQKLQKYVKLGSVYTNGLYNVMKYEFQRYFNTSRCNN